MRRWMMLLFLISLCLMHTLPLAAYSGPATLKPRSPLPPLEGAAGAPDDPTLALTALVQAADLIVRGRVSAVESFWTPDHSLIESAVTVAVTYPIVGQGATSLTVYTAGGFLADAGIGMISMHAASFTPNEEVLLLLQAADAGWQVVDGAAGKFTIDDGAAVNADLALRQPLGALLADIEAVSTAAHLSLQLPLAWRQWEPHLSSGAVPAPQAQSVACKWPTPHAQANFVVNINTAQAGGSAGDRSVFRQAIRNAAATWSAVAQVDFALVDAGDTAATQTSYNGVNEVLFMHKGPTERAAAAQVWYNADHTIVEADIWINDDYTWNATGAPGANEVDLQSAVLHEFGHWLILGHLAERDAVMFAKLTAGTLKRDLQQPDMQGISALYPR
jgi:predicted Zn-dependent protease